MAFVVDSADERLVKSTERVRDLGEVFTPNATVQEMLNLLPAKMWAVGHRRVQTTFRYDRRPQDQLLAAIDSLELPGLRDIDEFEK